MPGRVRRTIQRYRYRSGRGAVILRYHRVADLESDPHAIAVSPRHFGEQLEVLRRDYAPLGLTDLVHTLARGSLPRRGVVVTFDDGYADNLTTALPLLEQYEVPATVFVTTGYVGQSREFWWDTLERVLLLPGRLPSRLDLAIDGHTRTWSLGAGATYGQEDFERHRDWNWRLGQEPTVRHQLFGELFRRLQPLEEEVRRPVIHELQAWAGTPADERPSHRVLTAEEIVHLHASPLVEIGAHSATHPLFSRLPPARRTEEIEASKAFLEDTVGAPIPSFAYPYGDEAESAQLVAAAAFESACTTASDLVFGDHDPYRLPRLYVGNWDGDVFARHLRRWT